MAYPQSQRLIMSIHPILYTALVLCILIQICSSCLECGGTDPALEAQHAHRTESESSTSDSNGGNVDKTGISDDLPQEDDAGKSSSPQDPSNKENAKTKPGETGNIAHLETYKRLFESHRAKQLSGIKALMSFGKNEQRFQLINIMLNQLFKVLQDAKNNVTEVGYLPGDPFPTNEITRDAVSKVLENTAMFGDLVLHLPEAVHSTYDRKTEWQLLLSWSYGFCLESQVFEGPHKKLLTLMAKEVDIIPKGDDYVNPFKGKKYQDTPNFGGPDPKKKEKKPKRKKERGPKLSHTEL